MKGSEVLSQAEAEELILTVLQLDRPASGGDARLVEDLALDSIALYELALLLEQHCRAGFPIEVVASLERLGDAAVLLANFTGHPAVDSA